VYKVAFESAMKIYEISRSIPKEEQYSLTDQIRRSSRSVCANLAEAFRKRIYPRAFISKSSDSEGEAAETQNWLDFALNCKFNFSFPSAPSLSAHLPSAQLSTAFSSLPSSGFSIPSHDSVTDDFYDIIDRHFDIE
jgi:four helix bundle protein